MRQQVQKQQRKAQNVPRLFVPCKFCVAGGVWGKAGWVNWRSRRDGFVAIGSLFNSFEKALALMRRAARVSLLKEKLN